MDQIIPPASTFIQSVSSPSPFRLLSQSLRLFLTHFPYLLKFWLVQILITLASFLPALIGYVVYLSNNGLLWLTVVLAIISIVIFIPASLILAAAYLSQIGAVVDGVSRPIKDLFSSGSKLALPLLFINFLSSLATSLGLILLVIPGLVFGVWFIFSQPVLVYEGLSGPSALSRSKSLSQGRFWTVFKLMAVPIFIYIAYAILVSLATGLLPLSASLQQIVSQVLTAPVGYIGLLYVFLLYKSLK